MFGYLNSKFFKILRLTFLTFTAFYTYSSKFVYKSYKLIFSGWNFILTMLLLTTLTTKFSFFVEALLKFLCLIQI